MSFVGFRKLLVIGFMGAVLWVALITVLDVISERSKRRSEVYEDMARISAGSQVMAGPFLVFPYEIQTPTTIIDPNGTKRAETSLTRSQEIVFPRQLLIDGKMETEKRFRSLYEILLYGTKLKLDGRFEFAEPKAIDAPVGSSIRRLKPYLVVLIKDSRGLTTIPTLNWNDKSFDAKPGHRDLTHEVFGGFHFEIPAEVSSGGSYSFSIDFFLRGTQSFGWIPVGDETKLKLAANWPHPSFQGRGLPKSHEINKDGFVAEWESSQFSTNIAQRIKSNIAPSDLDNLEVGVKFIQPVDIYVQTERSVKYGFLFIALTFAAFLLFETLNKLSIHPIQYGFVGLALVLFYVLLLALSEHIAFASAYIVATVASTSLLGFYVRYVLRSWVGSLGFTAALLVLYGVIYGILLSEDYALLYGSVLLFTLLASAMIVTRRVNWNEVKLVN